MGIQYTAEKAPEDAPPPLAEQGTIVQPMGSPMPPRLPHGKRERRFIVGVFIVLVLIFVLGSMFALQLASRLSTQPSATTPATPPTPASPASVYPPINALWMSDATTGWARTTTQRIVRTSDGGRIWQDVTPPDLANSLGQFSPAFASLGGNVAWVAGFEKRPDGTSAGVVFRTSDGGQNWQHGLLPTRSGRISQVQFVNARDGWILSSPSGGAAGSEGVDLFRSTDGGQTWNLVARAPGALPFQGIKSGMSWISPTMGWITGSVAIPNAVYLYRTLDGGVTWQLQSLPPSFPVQATQPPFFFSAAKGLLPVAVSAFKGPAIAIYTTLNGGATWSTATIIPVECAWDFLTMQQGWVVGANGTTLFETNNGSRLWTMMIPSANFRHISQLDFVSAHEGWAISSTIPAAPTLLKTTDGGQTWAQVLPTPTPFKVRAG